MDLVHTQETCIKMGIVLEMVGELEKENSEWLFLIKC
jgi:hypothetical protein